MRSSLSHIPALQPLVGWIAGILLWWWGALAVVAIVAAVAGVAMLIAKRHAIGFIFSAIACGWLVAEIASPAAAPTNCCQGYELEYSGGVTLSRSAPESYTYIIYVDSVQAEPCTPFAVQVFTAAGGEVHRRGERLQFAAMLQPAVRPRDFDVQPSMTAYCYEHSIVAQAFVDGEDLHCVGFEPSWRTRLDGWREAVLHRLARCGLSDDAFGVTAAMVVAYTDELPGDVREVFQAAGVAHVLALSGFHVGVIVLIVNLLLWPLRLWPRLRWLRLLLMVAAVWAFALLVGLPWSVVRSAVMLTVFVVGLLVGRPANGGNSLCVALLVILAVNPFALFSAGLQLSACAVAGILLFYKVLNPINPRRRWRYRAMGVVAVSVAAVMGTLAPTVAHFHSLPLLFLPANLLIAILMPVLMSLGLLIAILPAGCGAAQLIGGIENWMVEMCDGFARWMGQLPCASVDDIYLGAMGVIALIAIVLAIAWAVNWPGKREFIICGSVVAVAAIVMVVVRPQYPQDEMVTLRHHPCVTLLMRHNDSLVVAPACRPEQLQFVAARLERDLDAYVGSRGVAVTTVTLGDFDLGPYSRRDEMFSINGLTVAMPMRTDTVEVRCNYLLLTPLTREKPSAMAERFHADTVLLAPTFTLRRANALRQAFAPVPAIPL
ncbi:MAG: ComEC/Rec2 family competence protein [Muribaculaceae bacterium]